MLGAAQLRSPPSVCRGFSPETDPRAHHKGTKKNLPAQILSPHFTRQELPSPPTPPTYDNSLMGHSLACSTPAHSQSPTDRGKFRGRALLLRGPHPANLPLNSRLQAHGSRGEARPREPQGGPERWGQVQAKKKKEWPAKNIADRRVIS